LAGIAGFQLRNSPVQLADQRDFFAEVKKKTGAYVIVDSVVRILPSFDKVIHGLK